MSDYYRTYRPGPYRSRHGVIFGVCRGLADYRQVSVFWVRVVAVILFIFSWGWVTVGYIAAALLMKPEPIIPLETDDDVDFYNSYASSRKAALHRIKRTYDNLERRIQSMESIVTSRDYDWERRMKK